MEGAQLVDECLGSLTAYVQGTLYNDMQRVAGTADAAAAMAKKDTATMTHLNLSASLITIRNLTARVGDMEMQVLFLQDLLKESGDLMLGITKGVIPVAGHPGRTGI